MASPRSLFRGRRPTRGKARGGLSSSPAPLDCEQPAQPHGDTDAADSPGPSSTLDSDKQDIAYQGPEHRRRFKPHSCRPPHQLCKNNVRTVGSGPCSATIQWEGLDEKQLVLSSVRRAPSPHTTGATTQVCRGLRPPGTSTQQGPYGALRYSRVSLKRFYFAVIFTCIEVFFLM